MKLVNNWQSIVKGSHSMWAVYLGIALLAFPELFFGHFGYQLVSPYLTGWGGIALLAYGGLGRIWDQGISHGGAHSSFFRRNWPLWLVIGLLIFGSYASAMGTGKRPEAPTISGSHEVTEKEFAAIAVPFVGKWEGLRLVAYQDIVGVWTVCYGETKGVTRGMKFTKRQCDEMFSREILNYRNGWHGYLTEETVMQRLTPKRDVAYVSLAYNVGVAGAGKSTATRRLNAGDIAGGCQAIGWWNKAGGRVVRGLVRRRTEEVALCMEGYGG